MKWIEVRITKDGETTITAHGYEGSECVRKTRRLEDALGKKTSDAPTAEMYGTAGAAACVENQG